VIEVEPDRFEEMVAEALDGLPPELGRLMRNVAVTVEHNPGPRGLLGLYQGVPLTSRTSQYAGVLPDRITIYRQAICAICRTEAEVADQVRRTVIHEIAHHFGIDDDRLRELGWLPTARWLLLTRERRMYRRAVSPPIPDPAGGSRCGSPSSGTRASGWRRTAPYWS
jgi:predicted Zn-dependent protease with MMP-like domain